jgi:proteasome lid subunit RPN8/RPN11
MKLKAGTKVLIKAKIVRQAVDGRPKEECGYLVKTSRGECYVEPGDILVPLEEC